MYTIDSMTYPPEMMPVIQALICDYGLQKIADAASEVMGNPLWIIDMNSVHMVQIAGNPKDEWLIEESKLGYSNEEVIRYAGEMNMRDKINESKKAVLFHSLDGRREILNIAVRIMGIIVGYIGVVNENRDFTPDDYAHLEMISLIVSSELQKDSIYQDNKELMQSFFLLDLLQNSLKLPDIEKRIELMGLKLKKNLYLLTVALKHVENRRIILHSLHQQLHYICQDSIYCQYEQHMIFFFTIDIDINEDKNLLKRIHRLLKESHLTAALSNGFKDICMLPHHYKKTLDALRIGSAHKPNIHLYRYSELTIEQVVDILQGSLSSSDLACGAVDKLTEYDKEHHSSLFPTMKTYLEKGHSIPRTAQTMNLHVNTIRQRLSKIEEITDCELENGHTSFELMLAAYLKGNKAK